MVNHFGQYCGEYHLLWKVKDFRRCYEEAASEVREVIYSPAFECQLPLPSLPLPGYSPAFDTHRNGYRLQMSCCPAGDGKGDVKYQFFASFQKLAGKFLVHMQLHRIANLLRTTAA